jgi:putative serine protease PepD
VRKPPVKKVVVDATVDAAGSESVETVVESTVEATVDGAESESVETVVETTVDGAESESVETVADAVPAVTSPIIELTEPLPAPLPVPLPVPVDPPLLPPAPAPAPASTGGLSFLRRPVVLDSVNPNVISSTVIVAMLIGALIGGLSGAVVSGAVGNIPQSVVINGTQNVSEVAAAAAKGRLSVVTIDVSGIDSNGSGSGVIISPDGYILTNAHVITLNGAASGNLIKVTNSQGERYNATVVGVDAVTDLAVIKVTDATGFSPVAWADSDAVDVGDTAVGIGTPIGLSGTVTSGIVSALNRGVILNDPAASAGDTEPQAIWVPAIQTDAAINHGNSGGALLNNRGELIGVNVAIANVSGIASAESGNIGIGFAIEGNVARRIANEIIATGTATHALLGATVAPATLNPDAANLGAQIVSVVEESPADSSGLTAGDVIIRFNGKPIADAMQLTAQVRAVASGSDAEIIYVRDGKARSVNLVLGDLENIAP